MQRQKTDDRENVNLHNKMCGLASLTVNHISVDASVWKELHWKVGSNVQQVREECYLHKHKDRENKK